ncbi:MAG: tellurite resistance/C4-dicarboxylate transporter family protein [Proteobacteria bacterium]|nr:tellurite resistance/C4-dicarboxylate transporter family protein [Pseudomonadota bacterium]
MTKPSLPNDNKNWLKHLYPGYFSLTMATGIVAIALELRSMPVLSDLLYGITLFSWLVLLFLYSWRLLAYPKTVLENLLNPRTTFIFFTFVAATNICGLLLFQHGLPMLALAFWLMAFVFWSVLMYFSFSALCFSHQTRNVNVVHGGWLILIVGTQSLVLLGSKIAGELGKYAALMMVEIHMLWALGMIFYAIFVTLFCYCIFFLNMELSDYSPLMWVIMGAAAISANAGSNLLLTDPVIPLLVELRPVVQMFSIMLWTWASWWIPLLVIFGLWIHGYRKIPLKYEPTQWSIVFPLGMYAVATNNLALSAEFSPLIFLAEGMLWIALSVWLLVMTALIRRLLNNKNTRNSSDV